MLEASHLESSDLLVCQTNKHQSLVSTDSLFNESPITLEFGRLYFSFLNSHTRIYLHRKILSFICFSILDGINLVFFYSTCWAQNGDEVLPNGRCKNPHMSRSLVAWNLRHINLWWAWSWIWAQKSFPEDRAWRTFIYHLIYLQAATFSKCISQERFCNIS